MALSPKRSCTGALALAVLVLSFWNMGRLQTRTVLTGLYGEGLSDLGSKGGPEPYLSIPPI